MNTLGESSLTLMVLIRDRCCCGCRIERKFKLPRSFVTRDPRGTIYSLDVTSSSTLVLTNSEHFSIVFREELAFLRCDCVTN